MIKIQDMNKRLELFQLKDISFEFPTGYICWLVGKNGAGKTTLLKTILGLYKPDGGELKLFDKSYEEERPEILDQIGTVLIDDYFDDHNSLITNAKLYGHYFSRFDQKKFLEYMERFGMASKLSVKYKKVSRGEKLKFQFAFALAHDPKLLVLDEPTGNFDPDFRKEFFDCLMAFMEDGEHSVILATHLTDDLDRIADYLLYIEEGKVVFHGDIESFHEQYRMVHGPKYKIELLPKENIIYLEEGEYDTKALVKHTRSNAYDEVFQVVYPSIEDFMFYYSKRNVH